MISLTTWVSSDRIDTVNTALSKAFDKPVTHIARLEGGHSSSTTFAITVDTRPYVLRVMGLDRDIADRTQQIRCLILAGERGVGPRCLYANAAGGVAVSQFISSTQHPGNHAWMLAVAKTLRDLHTGEPFPAGFELFDYIEELFVTYKTTAPDYLVEHLREILALKFNLAKHRINAACHNDLNPNNLLYDGERCILIDWEAAGLGDPYFDLATVCNLLGASDALNKIFLDAYFDRSLTSSEYAKLLAMRQVSYAFYALHFLLMSEHDAPPPADAASLEFYPDVDEWRRGHQTGAFALRSPEDFRRYGLALIRTSQRVMGSREYKLWVPQL